MKSPRFYYQDIAKLKTRDEKLAALQEVPEHLQGMVKTYLNIEIEFRKYRKGANYV